MHTHSLANCPMRNLYVKQLHPINYNKREFECGYDANAPIGLDNANKIWLKYAMFNVYEYDVVILLLQCSIDLVALLSCVNK